MRHQPYSNPLVDQVPSGSISSARAESQAGANSTPQKRSAENATSGVSGVGGSRRVDTLHEADAASPVQIAKVRCPLIRRDTLERARLLDWMHSKVRGRVVLVIADAGYGKTTLLADFSRRTRLRTLWYRMDGGDKDWVSLIQCLIASGRQHDPTFAHRTMSMLAEIDGDIAARHAILDSFLDELSDLTGGGAVLILDDYQLVEDSADCRDVLQALVTRGPDRLSVVISSRHMPAVALGRLRVAGEVAELRTDDLRFDLTETTRLFNNTYGRHLESDVVVDLAVRTEGWIASLQLVEAALGDRTPADIRRFVRNLTGADRDLYDYLAEEVVGDLPASMQQFLMYTSVLQFVTPELAQLVSGADATEVGRLTSRAERMTLLSRVSGGQRSPLRYHSLVREFLEARLESTIGATAVGELHRQVARAAAATNWRMSAHHYREAGDGTAVLETVDAAIPTIMANAQYSVAEGFIRDLPSERRPAGPHLVLSRVDLQQGDYESAARASQAVLDVSATDPIQRDHALLNLLTVSFNFGDGERAMALAVRLRDTTSNDNLRAIAEASIGIMEASTERDLEIVNRRLMAMARTQRRSQAHHFGVSMYNLAANSLVSDRLVEAERQVGEALRAFAGTSSVVERQAAAALRIGILLRTGRQSDALAAFDTLISGEGPIQNDVLLDMADTFDAFGDSVIAEGLLDRLGDRSVHTLVDRRTAALTFARVHLRRGETDLAHAAIHQYPDGIATVVGMAVWRQTLEAEIALAQGDPSGPNKLSAALAKAHEAGIHGARRVAELLLSSVSGPEALAHTVTVVGSAHPWHITAIAHVLTPHLSDIGDDARAVIGKAAATHPARWRTELRQAMRSPKADNLHVAELLEQIGERPDIRLLRGFAKDHRKDRRAAQVGKSLARRLAHSVFVEDQGRVVLRAGEREIEGATIRRKVLALLCFLLSRPGMSAARDQVLDTLWPELDPDVAANSLNQTLYFLRRVLEQDYDEDLSPGYVHYESDVIWLDPELVTSRSSECRRLMRSLPPRPTPDDVSRLVATYHGRFALDFEYEGWASEFRDSIHAEYLEIVERSLIEDVSTGHHDRAIKIARRALDVDPRSERVEESLLRLYKATGAHSAAAEQYSHYSGVLREELGIDSPPLESL